MTALPADLLPLRRLVLAVSVLEDLDVEPAEDGVTLTGDLDVLVPWTEIRRAVGDHRPDSMVARHRLARWLRLRAAVATLDDRSAAALRPAARALALPADHACHPGPDWVTDELLGGVLQCGIGLVGVLDDPVEVLPLPPDIAACAGIRPASWWPALREHAHDMGQLAVQRLRRDSGERQQVLRPVGGVDVPTLLMAPALREHLAGEDGSGMRALAIPMRTRGWFDLARIDPAFVGAAWSATDEPERALPVPVLVTADEVGVAPVGGDVLDVLGDRVTEEAWRQDVRYR